MTKQKITKPKPVHYVDNKLLFETLVAFLAKAKTYKLRPRGKQPRTPEYIGECLLKIARRLSNKPNFASYTFRDDMISDAVENALLYMHNFDPAKSRNPFAYFTQIIHFAFIRRIEREKRHVYTKYKYAMRQSQLGNDHFSSDNDTTGDLHAPAWTAYENVQEFIRDYELKLSKPKRKKGAMPALDIDNLDDEDITLDILDEDNDDNDEGSLMDKIPVDGDDVDDGLNDDSTSTGVTVV